ncbi:FxLYD domain-containing protein [Blastopirellula marina]|uniref:Uncharacterized protein n=1 Tax=Blastopirellula marina DSM 3645 TaxID=314230 RepID=A3ZSS0_9BACT|nr:FxLYD domain-containing protein [Blastopirellula marina]EAQ80344.1 hypothetical protein DSM3645_10882 [Blastopirellula marina DSM 3645]
MKPASTITLIVIICFALLGGAIWLNAKPGSTDLQVELANLRNDFEELENRTANLESVLANRSLPSFLQPPPKHRGKIDPNIPDKSWTAERLMTAYMQAETWPERLPLLRDPEAARPVMEAHYERYVRPASYKIHPIIGDLSKNGALLVQVTVENNIANYIVIQTSEGPRIDWLASKRKWAMDDEKIKAQKEQELIAKWNLEGATIVTKLLKKEQVGEYTYLHVQVKNSSQAYLSYLGISATLYDRDGGYVGKETSNESDISPGETVVIQVLCRNTSTYNVAKVDLKLDGVTVKDRADHTFQAEKWFQLIQE